MVAPDYNFWKIPVLTKIEYVVKKYDPSWAPIVTVNPLSSATTPNPAYDDLKCPFVAPITWTQTKSVVKKDGSNNQSS